MGNQITNLQGIRVLEVIPDSPGATNGLVPFLDFIVDIETFQGSDKKFTPENFYDIITENENQKIILVVINIRLNETRKVQITPNKEWNAKLDSLLGITVRSEYVDEAIKKTYKINHIYDNTPAQRNGLIPQTDYFLGFTNYKHQDLDSVVNILQRGNPVKMCVFNVSDESIRFIQFQGEKIIGCEFGGGERNQLPNRQIEKPLQNDENSQQKDIVQILKMTHPSQIMHKKKQSRQRQQQKILPPKNPFLVNNQTDIVNKSLSEESNDIVQTLEFKGDPKYYVALNYENTQKMDNTIDLSNSLIEPFQTIQDNLKTSLDDLSITRMDRLDSLKIEKIPPTNTAQKIQNNQLQVKSEIKKQIISTKYIFFCEKINKEYSIQSEDLFQVSKRNFQI